MAALAIVVAAASLGRWQLHRAAHKEQLQSKYENAAQDAPLVLSGQTVKPEELILRRMQMRGKFDPSRVVYLDSRVYRGVAGYHVIMPLRLGDGDQHVLVNRGWVRADADRGKLPLVETAAEAVSVSGIAVALEGQVFELSERGYEGIVWQHLKLQRYRERFGIAPVPVLVMQQSDSPDGLVRDWPPPNFGIERHYGYAFQWFALAVAMLILYGVQYVRVRRKR